MNQTLKVISITLLFFVLAALSSFFVQPSTAKDMAEYKKVYEELAGKAEITPEEAERRETLFRKINSKEHIQKEVTEIIIRNVAIALILIPVALVVGRKVKLETNQVLATGGLIFCCFIVTKVPAFGAISTTAFIIAALAFKKKSDDDPGEEERTPS